MKYVSIMNRLYKTNTKLMHKKVILNKLTKVVYIEDNDALLFQNLVIYSP